MLLATVNHSPSQTGAVVDDDSGHNRVRRKVPVVHQRCPKANQANDQRRDHLWRRPRVLDPGPGERKNARCCASDDDCVPAVVARLSAINPVSVMKSGGRTSNQSRRTPWNSSRLAACEVGGRRGTRRMRSRRVEGSGLWEVRRHADSPGNRTRTE